MIRTVLFIGGILLCSFQAWGQGSRSASAGGDILRQLQEEELAGGQIRIELDTLLEANYYKFMVMNSKASGIPGYRIRIFSESGIGAKEKQQRMRARFLSYFPEIDAYNRYDEPYFKLYVGDCRTKSEAIKLYDRIERNFPNPIIVEDYINIRSSE